MILSLETLTNESRARELTGCRLLIPASKQVEKAMNETGLPDIRDFIVIDTLYGELGKAVEIVDVAGNPLLRIISGKKRNPVPVHPDIILDVSEKKKIIRIKAPKVLIDFIVRQVPAIQFVFPG